jgi:formylmethanofuran dehydrogenase subunit E
MDHHDEYSQDELLQKLHDLGYDPVFQDYYRRCIPFHTYPAPGLLIAIGMVDYAFELLGAKPGDKVYATCETVKCAPDPLQVIANCTIGNHRLQIVNIGRFAFTMNRPSMEETIEGVRVFIDPVKINAYPVLAKWFANSPEFKKGSMTKALLDDILNAKRSILSYQKVKVRVNLKKKWNSAVCKTCGEAIPEQLIEGDKCAGCGSLRYYDLV